jgi:hypothetical protein
MQQFLGSIGVGDASYRFIRYAGLNSSGVVAVTNRLSEMLP